MEVDRKVQGIINVQPTWRLIPLLWRCNWAKEGISKIFEPEVDAEYAGFGSNGLKLPGCTAQALDENAFGPGLGETTGRTESPEGKGSLVEKRFVGHGGMAGEFFGRVEGKWREGEKGATEYSVHY